MWSRFFFYRYQSLLLETRLFLVLGCFWSTAPSLRSGKTKWPERLRWESETAQIHSHCIIHKYTVRIMTQYDKVWNAVINCHSRLSRMTGSNSPAPFLSITPYKQNAALFVWGKYSDNSEVFWDHMSCVLSWLAHRTSSTRLWRIILSASFCPEVGSDPPEKRPNIFTTESSLRSDTETCVHMGVHVDIAL